MVGQELIDYLKNGSHWDEIARAASSGKTVSDKTARYILEAYYTPGKAEYDAARLAYSTTAHTHVDPVAPNMAEAEKLISMANRSLGGK